MTFITKPKKTNYTDNKACCLTNLFSFMPNMMEKLVERHIRDEVLRFILKTLCLETGKSTATVLHNAVTYIGGCSGTHGNST